MWGGDLRHIYMPKLSIIAYKVLELRYDLESISLILCYTCDECTLTHMISYFRNSWRNWSLNEETMSKDVQKMTKEKRHSG